MRMRGFTIIELIVVVAIIGVLVVLIKPKYHAYEARSRRAEATVNIGEIASLLGIYATEHDKYINLPKVGYLGGGGTECDNTANTAMKDLGFNPEECEKMRYGYKVDAGTKTFEVTAFAPSDAEGRYIYPKCTGVGAAECGESMGDKIKATESEDAHICRDIIKHCSKGVPSTHTPTTTGGNSDPDCDCTTNAPTLSSLSPDPNTKCDGVAFNQTAIETTTTTCTPKASAPAGHTCADPPPTTKNVTSVAVGTKTTSPCCASKCTSSSTPGTWGNWGPSCNSCCKSTTGTPNKYIQTRSRYDLTTWTLPTNACTGLVCVGDQNVRKVETYEATCCKVCPINCNGCVPIAPIESNCVRTGDDPANICIGSNASGNETCDVTRGFDDPASNPCAGNSCTTTTTQETKDATLPGTKNCSTCNYTCCSGGIPASSGCDNSHTFDPIACTCTAKTNCDNCADACPGGWSAFSPQAPTQTQKDAACQGNAGNTVQLTINQTRTRQCNAANLCQGLTLNQCNTDTKQVTVDVQCPTVITPQCDCSRDCHFNYSVWETDPDGKYPQWTPPLNTVCDTSSATQRISEKKTPTCNLPCKASDCLKKREDTRLHQQGKKACTSPGKRTCVCDAQNIVQAICKNPNTNFSIIAGDPSNCTCDDFNDDTSTTAKNEAVLDCQYAEDVVNTKATCNLPNGKTVANCQAGRVEFDITCPFQASNVDSHWKLCLTNASCTATQTQCLCNIGKLHAPIGTKCP